MDRLGTCAAGTALALSQLLLAGCTFDVSALPESWSYQFAGCFRAGTVEEFTLTLESPEYGLLRGLFVVRYGATILRTLTLDGHDKSATLAVLDGVEARWARVMQICKER